jgi:hypothetical protein
MRWLVAGFLAAGLISSSLAAAAVGPARLSYERTHHSCAKAVLAECCCQPKTDATGTALAFAELWAGVNQLCWESACWIADVSGTSAAVDVASALNISFRSDPPASSFVPSDSLTVLLI